MDSKGCQMDSFNTVFSPAYQSLPIVSKEIKKSKGCPIVYFNTAFSLACLSPFLSLRG